MENSESATFALLLRTSPDLTHSLYSIGQQASEPEMLQEPYREVTRMLTYYQFSFDLVYARITWVRLPGVPLCYRVGTVTLIRSVPSLRGDSGYDWEDVLELAPEQWAL